MNEPIRVCQDFLHPAPLGREKSFPKASLVEIAGHREGIFLRLEDDSGSVHHHGNLVVASVR
ncbi:MAG: hypothetical protein VCA34_03125, partial [Roseibacillus sp.]